MTTLIAQAVPSPKSSHRIFAVVFSFPGQKIGHFSGRGWKNDSAVQKRGLFYGQGPGYLLYLHD